MADAFEPLIADGLAHERERCARACESDEDCSFGYLHGARIRALGPEEVGAV